MSKGMDEKGKFEEAMAKLEDVVKKLESGDGTLAEMIGQYEQGMRLIKVCNDRLDAYEAKITKLANLEDTAHDDA